MYVDLCRKLTAVVHGVKEATPNLANAAALLWYGLEDINWAGFYLLSQGKLVLGPFQGKPACIYIPLGKGVCGTAAKENRTIRVHDVHRFPGHIACDEDSNSEIVIPIRHKGEVVGVLDVDSPVPGRFSLSDQEGLQDFVRILEDSCLWA